MSILVLYSQLPNFEKQRVVYRQSKTQLPLFYFLGSTELEINTGYLEDGELNLIDPQGVGSCLSLCSLSFASNCQAICGDIFMSVTPPPKDGEIMKINRLRLGLQTVSPSQQSFHGY